MSIENWNHGFNGYVFFRNVLSKAENNLEQKIFMQTILSGLKFGHFFKSLILHGTFWSDIKQRKFAIIFPS